MPVLAESELSAQVADMQGWEVRDGALQKAYSCGDFDGSMAFVNRVARRPPRPTTIPTSRSRGTRSRCAG